jgi:hypothetical protein
LSTGEADTIERPGSDAGTVLLSADLYVSKGSPASFEGGSRVAGRILSAIGELDRFLLGNGGGFIPDDFLINFGFVFIGEAELLPNILFIVVEETDEEALPPIVFCPKQINQYMSFKYTRNVPGAGLLFIPIGFLYFVCSSGSKSMSSSSSLWVVGT